jgi:hypothetical protein
VTEERRLLSMTREEFVYQMLSDSGFPGDFAQAEICWSKCQSINFKIYGRRSKQRVDVNTKDNEEVWKVSVTNLGPCGDEGPARNANMAALRVGDETLGP